MEKEVFNKLFEEYKSLQFVPSIEDERQRVFSYIYSTNKLEGNKLTLAQTTSLLEKGIVSGDNIRLHDILEHKGMYKAINRVFNAVIDREELSIDLLINLNWLTLSSLWKDENAYLSAKEKGQKEKSFKMVENIIRINHPGQESFSIDPISDSKSVKSNMIQLVDKINKSREDCITKAAFLAQELWIHQPFLDGNKRTGRLLINFLTLKEGYPLFSYDDKGINYNSLLVEQYIKKRPGLLKNYIREKLSTEMKNTITLVNEAKKNRDKGYRFMI